MLRLQDTELHAVKGFPRGRRHPPVARRPQVPTAAPSLGEAGHRAQGGSHTDMISQAPGMCQLSADPSLGQFPLPVAGRSGGAAQRGARGMGTCGRQWVRFLLLNHSPITSPHSGM